MEHIALPNVVLLGEAARLLNEGREVVLIPKGHSMRPFIRGEGERVRLRPPGALRVGDIVLAHFDGRFLLHRIYALAGDEVTLMGDGNLQGTEQGPASDVIGVVAAIITKSGKAKKPTSGRLWRRLLPIRKYLLRMHRIWNKLFDN